MIVDERKRSIEAIRADVEKWNAMAAENGRLDRLQLHRQSKSRVILEHVDEHGQLFGTRNLGFIDEIGSVEWIRADDDVLADGGTTIQ